MKCIQIFLFLYYLHDIGQCGITFPNVMKKTDELAISNLDGNKGINSNQLNQHGNFLNQNQQSNFRNMYLPTSSYVSVFNDNNVGFGYRVQNGDADVWVSSNINPWMNIPKQMYNTAWNMQQDTLYYYPKPFQSEMNLKSNIFITNGHPFTNSISQIYNPINREMNVNPSEVNDLSNDESSIQKVSTKNSSKVSDQSTSPSTDTYSKKNSSVVDIMNRKHPETNIPVMNNYYMLKPSDDLSIIKSMNTLPNNIVLMNTKTMAETGLPLNSENIKNLHSPPIIVPNTHDLQQTNFQTPQTHFTHIPLMQNLQLPNTLSNVQKIQIPFNSQTEVPNVFSAPLSQNFQQQSSIPNVRIINPIPIQKIRIPTHILHTSPLTETSFPQNFQQLNTAHNMEQVNAESVQKIEIPLNSNFVQVSSSSPFIRVPVLQSYQQPILNLHSPLPNIPVPYQRFIKIPRSLLRLLSFPQNNYVYEPMKTNPEINLQMLMNRDKRSFYVNNNDEETNGNAFQRLWLNGHGYANGEIRNIVGNNNLRKSRYLESTPDVQHSFVKNEEH